MKAPMDHLKRVADEFTRQAQNFETWAAKADHFKPLRRGARRNAPRLNNVTFKSGDAENLPFNDAEFDGVVTRLAIHHFANPQRALDEMFRVLRPRGVAVIVDVVSSEDRDESKLHNAIERLRDPSHVRMLPASELDAGVSRAGFRNLEHATWDMDRELEEWLAIVDDPARVEPIGTVIRTLAESGRTAGFGLSVNQGRVVFFHRWRLIRANKPTASHLDGCRDQ